MIDGDKIYHVYPKNDLRKHILVSEFPIVGKVHCSCPCEPDWKQQGDSVIIIHNSFDGREGLEWVNEILNTTTG